MHGAILVLLSGAFCIHPGQDRPAPADGRSATGPPAQSAASQPAPSATSQPDHPAPPLGVTQAETVRTTFNPSIGQSGDVRFMLSREAGVTVRVYGPNHEEVATVVESRSLAPGWHTVSWNGRDREGDIVPNEAYYATIQAVSQGEGVVVDPVLTSGGERIIAAEVQPLEDGRRLSYQLPKPCRVLVRAAVVEGPLLRTLVNWEPRSVGLCIEHWDGRDADGLRRILDVQNARIAVMAFALPELTLITTGNAETNYRDYYLNRAMNWPQKPPVARAAAGDNVVSPHALLPPHLNRDPGITLSFPGQDERGSDGAARHVTTSMPASLSASQPADSRVITLTSNSALFRVDVPDPIEQEFLNNQKFELIVYVDDRRIIELEQGHVPLTYPWDLTGLTPGRHVLTVNLASFRNHVGTVSRMVEIRR